MAKVQKSRFALLKVEDDSDTEQQQSKEQNKSNQQSKNSQKKTKNKKKKVQQQHAESSELKYLAFGQTTRPRNLSEGSDSTGQNGHHGAAPEKQWDEWQKMDAEFTAGTFEKDLQQALLLSKLETERQSSEKKKQASTGSVQTDKHIGSGDAKEAKKKKKKDKPNTMSLEEFNKQIDEKKTNSDDLEELLPQPSHNKVPIEGFDSQFFTKVDTDVNKIIHQEKMQEEYKIKYATESVITAKYQEEVSMKIKEIEFLRATLKKHEVEHEKHEEELKQVKKRNKQLCVILAQGEMKDKAEVLMQVDQLTEVKDELTEQVSELTADLEKERSKVHALRTELEKYKGGKHKYNDAGNTK